MRKPERFAGETYEGERTKGTRIGTLWLKESMVEGDVTLTLEFLGMDGITKLDVLGDIIGLLEREVNLAHFVTSSG
jgi:hypothetical protein